MMYNMAVVIGTNKKSHYTFAFSLWFCILCPNTRLELFPVHVKKSLEVCMYKSGFFKIKACRYYNEGDIASAISSNVGRRWFHTGA